jgi:uncharacterized protein
VLVGIAAIMTAGVYGLVAGIVKLDDVGLYLSRQPGGLQRSFGTMILKVAPYLMKTLSIAGTAAMFLVGGGILTHGTPALHHWIENLVQRAGGVIGALVPLLIDALTGVIAGVIALAVVSVVRHVLPRSTPSTSD